MDYGNEWMINSYCFFDFFCCEICVIVLMDDKVLLMISCEFGVYNIVWLVWLVFCQCFYVVYQVWLMLLFQLLGEVLWEIELINVSYDDCCYELVILDKGCGVGDCGI